MMIIFIRYRIATEMNREIASAPEKSEADFGAGGDITPTSPLVPGKEGERR